jgi:hypothetical protein
VNDTRAALCGSEGLRPSHRRWVTAASFLVLLVAAPLAAQRLEAARVAVGTLLRVLLTNGEWRHGDFVADSPTHLQLGHDCAAACEPIDSVAWSDVRRVDAEVTLTHSVGRALAFGAAGAAIGAVVTVAAMAAYQSSSACDGELCGLGFALALPTVAGTGALIGIHHGWTHPARFWAPVWPPSAAR